MDEGRGAQISDELVEVPTGGNTWPRRAATSSGRRRFVDLVLPDAPTDVDDGSAKTCRTRTNEEASPIVYRELVSQLEAVTPLLLVDGGDGTSPACEEDAKALTQLATSYEVKMGRNMRASLQRTVARSVSHSLMRQLISCRVHMDHKCSVGFALVQLMQRLPRMPQQVFALTVAWS